MGPRFAVARDLLARAALVTLLALFSANLFDEFRRTGHLTGLLMLAGELLVIVFTLVRRPARAVDRSFIAVAATTISVAGPPLMRASEPGAVADGVTVWISVAALAVVVAAKLTLGRSFGLVPANRGIVAGGPYELVRHPIYAGYLVTHLAFLLAHPSPWNAGVVLAADTALIIRALHEERLLAADQSYQMYCRRVGWHLVPGVF